jgi:hypothetical protein
VLEPEAEVELLRGPRTPPWTLATLTVVSILAAATANCSTVLDPSVLRQVSKDTSYDVEKRSTHGMLTAPTIPFWQ